MRIKWLISGVCSDQCFR